MTEFFSKYKAAIGLLVLILLGFWLYTTLFPQPENIERSNEIIGAELFEVLAVLENITLDGSIFSDPDFLALQDFETEVPSGVAGRVNPFAPSGGDTGGTVVEPSYTVVPVSSAESFLDVPEEGSEESSDTETEQSNSTSTPATETDSIETETSSGE